MSTETTGPKYVLLSDGEVAYASSNDDSVLRAAQDDVDQMITDHYRHDLPLTMDEEKRIDFDIEVHRLDASSRVKLLLQEWADAYYSSMKEEDKKDEVPTK